jgi:hypothetical protein
MSNIVRGIYRNDQVQLLHKPDDVEEAELEVTLINLHRDCGDASLNERLRCARNWLREDGWHLGGAPYSTRDALHDRTRQITA